MNGSSTLFLLRPKWLAFHLLVFVSIALMIWLALWQLRRLDERQAFNATVDARIDQPAVPLDELIATTDDPRDLEWRQVTLSGVFQPRQIIWFNRSQEGIAGDNVLAALDDPTAVVVVNRGFVPLGDSAAAPPAGDVEVLGRVRIPPGRQLGELTDANDGPVGEVRRVDLDQLDAQIDGDVAPFYVDLIGSIPNVTDADPVPVPPPTLDEGPHLSYAVQWFIFATAVLVGWVLAVRRSLAAQRRQAHLVTDEPGVPDRQDSPPSAAAAATTTTP